jgi:Protein of unknown function (DUF3567)
MTKIVAKAAHACAPALEACRAKSLYFMDDIRRPIEFTATFFAEPLSSEYRARPLKTRRPAMNVIYNSDNYYVVEYPIQHGYELVDKQTQRGAYFHGDVADRFAECMRDAVAETGSVEGVDEFLGSFHVLMTQPVVYH